MHGLSTLNRLLGKKNKEVSRSTSNLSKSHSNLESSSQHNKKIPILNNAPFEQTFRVTVYLPKNQLYVERIGAKTKLEKLMNDVCDSKNLSIDKYEFRHPADMSQVFDNDKTIGEVGLNELRMVLKSESRYNGDFHRYHSRPDDIIKYKPTNVAESVSSSEISRSNLKNTSKTSPYSSTNSLNSLDSTGMNSSNQVQQPVAPIRKKKRAAPRPPSENSIPEQEIFSTSTLNVFKEPHSILPRKNFHVSSPQLYNSNINNNNYEIAQKSDSNNNHTELRSISNRLNAITRPSSLHFGSNTEIVKNLPERQRNNSESSEIQNIMRDSGSMQNSLERAKKKNPAPVPPTRKIKPTPSPRTIQEDMKSITEIKEVDEQESVVVSTQKIVGEIPIDNNPNNNSSNSAVNSKTEDENGNVSKVLLNNKSESSLETEGPISIQILSSEVNVEQRLQQEEKSNESVKLPVSKVHINHRRDETRSGSEGEEEEEMTVNIYNVTKSVVTCEKPAIIKETNKQISVVEGEQKHVIIENKNIVNEITPNVTKDEECQRSQSPEWTYTLPAPPIVGNSLESNNSNVNNNNNSPTDQKSAVGNKYFSDFTSTVNDNETILSDSNTTVISAETHIQPIINDRRKVLDDSFIMNPNDYTKPSTAAAAILDNQSDKSAEVITSDLEDGYLGNNNNISNDNEISVIEEVLSKPKPPNEDIQRSRLLAITRSDSFHSIGQQKRNEYYDGMIRGTNFNALLPQRSTSFLSLVHSQKAEMRSSSLMATSIKQDLNVPYNRQKSTSELSISDVPSLQSLEVIKNILNCRKNSLQDVNRKSALSDDINNDDKSAPIEEPKNIIRSSTLIQATETALTSTTSTSKIEVKSTEKVIYNTIEKRDIKKLETQKSEPAFVERNKNNNSTDTSNNNNMKKSETQQQWRYSGPPKINFSTWNERPKVEVSVMSDEDYIFGGSVHSTTLPRDFKNQGINQYSQNQNADSVDSYVKKSYSTVMLKNENKEAERHLPKVLGVEYKKDVVVLRNSNNSNNNNNNNNNKDTKASSSEITNRNNGNNSTKTLISIKQRPATMDYSSAISSSTTKTTLNSPNYQNQFVSFNNNNNSNSKKFTPIVHGFSKLDNISETQSDVKSLPVTNKITDANNEKRAEAPMIPVKPSYLRSASAVVDMNRNLKLSSVKNVANTNNNASNDAYDENPYSQTLRRTGLIEKMLNNDKKTESIFGRVLDKPKSTANNNPSNNSVQMNEEKQVEKVTIRQLSQPIPSTNNPVPPPPPPMIFRKSAPAVVVLGSDMNEGETRNQLLDAIKNFNKDSLRRK